MEFANDVISALNKLIVNIYIKLKYLNTSNHQNGIASFFFVILDRAHFISYLNTYLKK